MAGEEVSGGSAWLQDKPGGQPAGGGVGTVQPHGEQQRQRDIGASSSGLSQQIQHAQAANDALAALGIDWPTLWKLSKPQIEALVGILLQFLFSGTSGGAAPR